MPIYNKKLAWSDNSQALPTLVDADSFDHLPRCPSRVIPPLCMRIPSDFDFEFDAQHTVPKVLTSDADAIHWFLNIVRQACKCFKTLFDHGDFMRSSLEGLQYLTTRMLLSYKKAWFDASSGLDRGTLADICLTMYNLIHDYAVNHDEASDEARILVALISELMEHVYSKMTASHERDHHRPTTEYNWPLELRGRFDWSGGVADILAGRFLDSGKCLYTYSRISDLFGVEIVFYMSQLEGSEGNQKHDACTIHECYGHNINPETHRPTHIHPSCTCSLIDADLDSISDILDKPDLIPIMVFDQGADLKTRVVPQTKVGAYIAISYVASQLFASPLTNSLPACQMRTLRHIVRSVSKSLVKDGEICGVWIDTLHVPVEAVRQVSRDQALLKMKMTMEEAIVVMVVDPCLAKRSAVEFVPEEFMASVVCSPWFSRLWTFSESQFASNLWVWYQGSAKSIDAFLKERGWPPEGLSWRSYDELETIGRIRIMSRAFPNRPVQGHEHFEIIMEMLRHRQTSQPADEAFCLSMLMDLDTPGMLTRPVDNRMEFFYKQLRDISAVLLIQSGERLTTPGFRWAPTTLLGRKVVSRYAHPDDRTVRKDELGILVPQSYYACKLTLIASSQVTQRIDETLVRHIYFRIQINDTMYNTTLGDAAAITRHLLVMFQTTGNARDPTGEHSQRSQPFQIPGQQFILMHRGWMRAGGMGPAVLLVYEDPNRLQVLDYDQEPGKPRILTRYGIPGGFRVVTEKEEDKSEAEFGLAAAFDGDQPLNEDRAVFSAEMVPLSEVELWVS